MATEDKAVKAKAVPVMNGAFHHCMDHGNGGKFGNNGRAAVLKLGSLD